MGVTVRDLVYRIADGKAGDQLSVRHRRRLNRVLRSADHRSAFFDELLEQLAADNSVDAAFRATDFSADTFFEIDPEKLKQLLDLIVEYLPKILAIILPLFQ